VISRRVWQTEEKWPN